MDVQVTTRRTKADIIEWLRDYPDNAEIHITDERGDEVPIQALAHNPLTPRLVVDGTVATDLEMEWLLNRAAGE